MALSHSPNLVTNNLVFHFDAANTRSYAGSGVTINSLVGNFKGNLVNGAGFTSANAGSFFFDGSNDHIIFSNCDVMGSVYTQNYWFKRNDGGTHLLVDSFYSGTVVSSGGITYYYTNTGATLGASYNFIIGRWNMISLVRGATVKSIYMDGVLIASVNSSDSYDVSTTDLIIGIHNSLGFWGLNGNIAQLQIYNRALSAAEIKQNFNASRDRYGV
jgi:hypothetical protein